LYTTGHSKFTRRRPPPRFHSPKYWLLSASTNNQHQSMPESHLGFMIVYIGKSNTILALIRRHLWYVGLCPGGVLDISLGGEVRRGPSYPDPV